jgi:hypothetical protein
MPYAFDLSTPEDDAALRQVLARSPLPGAIALSFEREPSYFLANSTLGHAVQVLVGREIPSQQIVALAARVVRRVFVNGREMETGYLGQARLSGQPSPFVIARGFRFLKQLHESAPVVGYITTIVEENAAARSLLVERPLKHVPKYRELDCLHTLAIFARPGREPQLPGGAQVLDGARGTLGEIVAFLREHGLRRQFFPAVSEEYFKSDAARGFGADDFVVARRGGAIVGVAGLWDQKGFKQTRVRGYHGALKYLRPACNVAARLAGVQTLPRVGQRLRASYASWLCVAGDDAQVFRVLLRGLLRRGRARGDAYLLLGLCQSDPLLAHAQKLAHISYLSRLYSVEWENGFHDSLDGRPPYVEIATL